MLVQWRLGEEKKETAITSRSDIGAVLGLAFFTTMACGRVVPPPAPEVIDPLATVAGVEVSVTITGHDFHPAVHVDFRGPDNRVDSGYTAAIGGVTLEQVEWLDTETLTARVPATVPLGTHDVTITSPAGQTGALRGAFSVVEATEDADGDGVPDSIDVCPGFDDRLDGDDDGIADGCDLCPAGDDTIDSDGDGSADACDRCPGEDDTVDSNGDSVPDGCQSCAELSGTPCPPPDSCSTDFLVANDSEVCCPTDQCTGACPSDWYDDCAWEHRVRLTVENGQVPSPQSGFPTYVDLSLLGATFFGTAENDGSDILVTEADGVTALPRELEVLDVGNSSGALWFNAPTLQDGSVFYVYFGNSDATEANSTAVWDSSFLGVWHNSVDPSGAAPQIADSTSNGVHGDVAGDGMPASAQVPGKVGNCLDFNGADDYVELEGETGVLDHTGTGAGMQMTICAWVNPDGLTTSWPSIISKGDTQYHLKLHSTDRWEFKAGAQWHLSDDAISAPFTQWYHVCGVNDGAQNISYVNGVLQAETRTPSAINHDTYPVWMGLDSENTSRDPFDGFIDELKFSNTARGADWIQTEFNNQNDAASFWQVGTVESP